jgi:hypothetical protein
MLQTGKSKITDASFFKLKIIGWKENSRGYKNKKAP